MSTNFEEGVWYMTRDYQDMYKMERNGPVMWDVVSFGTWDVVFTFPGILGVQNYMELNCWDHEQIKENLKDE